LTGGIQALLVDLDGTLADTASANYAAYAAALAEAGVEVDRAAFDTVASGRNWRQFLPVLLGEKAAAAPQVAARKAALYPGLLADLRINRGLVALIEISALAGRPAALVTTASRGAVDAILETHDLARLFSATITGDDVTAHKPDKEPYVAGAAALGIPPAACLAIEDTAVGARSARAAGCMVLMVAGETI
jgi:HAD superfamily hydrolase (TIGR01509 family)